jgi:hypothetical protein
MRILGTLMALLVLVGSMKLLSGEQRIVAQPRAEAGPSLLPLTADVPDRHAKRIKVLWIASIAAMAVGTSADMASSWHKREANGLLASPDGVFGAKGIGIKLGIGAGVLLPQILFHKHKDLRRAFTVGNFAEAGLFTGTAIHNLGVMPPGK